MSSEKIIGLLRRAPRITINNLKDLPKSERPKFAGLNRKKRGLGQKGCSQFQNYDPLGSLREKTPFYLTVPKEPYNIDLNHARHYTRVSLLELQRLIDLGRINPNEPIDLASLCNTKLIKVDATIERNYGVHLTEEGLDLFDTPVNLEVQYASEPVIAAVERAGGVITTRFYDLFSVYALSDPRGFFKKGYPIPAAKTPPSEALDYYTSARNRGYLADPAEIADARAWLAQKYGYPVVDLSNSPRKSMLQMRKETNQVFHNLQASWIVCLADKSVIKPVKKDS